MYWRTQSMPFGRDLPRAQARAAVLMVYVGYPLGCLMRLFAADVPRANLMEALGFTLIVLAILAFAMLAGSSLQRQAQEPESQLDEREVQERDRATYRAYGLFCGLTLLAILYARLAHETPGTKLPAWWLPVTADQWDGVFLGFLLLAMTLPAACLAFQAAPGEDGARGDR